MRDTCITCGRYLDDNNSPQIVEIVANSVYTYADLQRIIGITKRTLSEYVDKKELRPIVFGNKYRFLGSEILRFLKAK